METDRRRNVAGAGSLPLQIALRYLRSTRKDAFISLLSGAAACGIALGVAALILALAALSGFQGALRDEILARTPEIEISPASGRESSDLVSEIESLREGLSAQRILRGRGWLLARGAARPVLLVAFDETLPTLFPGIDQRRQGLYIGSDVAEQWSLEVGEVVEVASPRPTLSPLGPQPRIRRLAIEGIFEAGRTELEHRVALPWAVGESVIGSAGLRILVSSGDLDAVDEIATAMAPLLEDGSTLKTWRDLNRALLFALRLEKSIMFLGVFLIVVVAVLALVSGLMLILASKRREVGMLLAMGATPGEVRRIFLWLAALLGGSGAAVGLGLGALLAGILDRGRLLRLPDQVYFLDYVPFRIEPWDVATVLTACLALTLACSLWASGRAARLDPVKALRR